MIEEDARIADRFTLAQSWRIGAELTRRHPHLLVTGLEDPDHIPILIAHDGAHGKRVQFDLTGGIQYRVDESFRRIEWPDVFAQPSSRTVVDRIDEEVEFGGAPAKDARGRVLVYSIIAKLLALHVDSDSSWQVAQAPLFAATSITDATFEALVDFPAASDAAERYTEEAIAAAETSQPEVFYWHEPLWFVYRDMDVVAVLDEAGWGYLPGGLRIDLARMWESLGEDAGALAGILLVPADVAVDIAVATGVAR